MDTNQAFNALEQSLKLLGEENKSWTWALDETKVSAETSNPQRPSRKLQFVYTKGPLRKDTQEKILIEIWQNRDRQIYIQVCEYERKGHSIKKWFYEIFRPNMIFTLALIIIFAVFLWNLFDLISTSYASESKPDTYIEAQQVKNNSLITIAKENVKERNDVQRD